MRRAKILLAGGLVLLLAAAGCGSGASDAAGGEAVDVSKLDTGGYSTSPVTLPKPTLEQARLSEGQRLASYLPLPMDIDPRLKYAVGAPQSTFGFTDEGAGTGLVSDNLGSDAPGFIAGFGSDGQSDQDIQIALTLHYSVLIFSDNQSAAAGAKKLGGIQSSRRTANQPVTLDGHSDTQAFWLPTTDTLESFTPSGNFVLYISIVDFAVQQVGLSDLSELTALAMKTIAAVPPALKNFRPVSVDHLTSTDADHDGLIGHSLFQAAGPDAGGTIGIYNQHGALLISTDPVIDRDLYAQTGTDWVVMNVGRLYRTRDPAAANSLANALSTVYRFYQESESPKNLPEARCIERKDGVVDVSNGVPRFHCIVAYNRYVAEVWSEQIIDVHQRISAQYALLAKQ